MAVLKSTGEKNQILQLAGWVLVCCGGYIVKHLNFHTALLRLAVLCVLSSACCLV